MVDLAFRIEITSNIILNSLHNFVKKNVNEKFLFISIYVISIFLSSISVCFLKVPSHSSILSNLLSRLIVADFRNKYL